MTGSPRTTAPKGPQVVHESRVLPRRQLDGREERERERAVPLSLLDATTANFGLTSAIWLLERPSISLPSAHLAEHLRTPIPTIFLYIREASDVNDISTSDLIKNDEGTLDA
jgi:hypothetical protein